MRSIIERIEMACEAKNLSNPGKFVELYNGVGIYWTNLKFNTGGESEYSNIKDVRSAIDKHIEGNKNLGSDKNNKLMNDKTKIRAVKNNDGTYRLLLPGSNGVIDSISKQKLRDSVFDLEDKYDASLVWIE